MVAGVDVQVASVADECPSGPVIDVVLGALDPGHSILSLRGYNITSQAKGQSPRHADLGRGNNRWFPLPGRQRESVGTTGKIRGKKIFSKVSKNFLEGRCYAMRGDNFEKLGKLLLCLTMLQ